MSRHSHIEPHNHTHDCNHNNEEKPSFNFVNLHCHTEYSTLDGVIRIGDVPDLAKGMGQDAIASTDHGNCAGHWAFYNSCVKGGVRPLLGMEAYYAVGDHRVRERDALGKPYYHLILIAANNRGLHDLHHLSSMAYTEGMYYKPRLSDQLLADRAQDLIATSACLGSRSSQLILNGDYKGAEVLLAHHAAMFKDKFFLELQVHKSPEQTKVNQALMDINKRLNLPLVVTADAHYGCRGDKAFHETTLKMATESSGDGFTFGDIECHLSSHDDMWARCKAMGIPYEAISNTVHVANMVDSNDYFSDRMNRWIEYKSLPPGVPSWQYLDAMARAGLAKRIGFPAPQEYMDRLDHELRMFKTMGRICDYLLVVSEYCAKARELGILVGPGRGSAAGSLVAYCLGITEIDPLRYGLIVERFVNEGRNAIPLIF